LRCSSRSRSTSARLAVDLEHLADQRLGQEGRQRLALLEAHQRGWHEGRQRPDAQLEPAGVLGRDARLDQRADRDVVRGAELLRGAARELPEVVLAPVELELEDVADLGRGLELRERGHALHARTELDEDVRAADPDHLPAHQLAPAGGRLALALVDLLQVDAFEGGLDLGREGVLVVACLGAHGGAGFYAMRPPAVTRAGARSRSCWPAPRPRARSRPR
jgi:hypothetical protein